jgi:hypothetical protein
MTTEATLPTAATTPDPQAEAAALWQQLADADAADSAATEPLDATESDAVAPVSAEVMTEPERTQPQGGGQTPNDDIWSSASEQQRAAYEAAQRQLQALDHDSRSQRGRVSALQREVDQFKKQLAALHGAAGSTGQGQTDASDADIRRLQEEYPEVARPVLKQISSLQQQLNEAQRRLDLRESTEAQREREQALDREEQALAQMHPDWDKVTARPEFTAWLAAQPRYVVEAIQRNGEAIVDAREAADVIGRFKQAIATAPATAAATAPAQPPATLSAKRQQQLQSAAGPAPRGAPKVTTGVPDDPEAAWRYWAERDKKGVGSR